MGIPIDWTSTTPSLHDIRRDLTGGDGRWPVPRPRASAVDDDERLRARADWGLRLCAAYATMADIARWHNNLVQLGAPMDVLVGAAYAVDEITHLVAVHAHILTPLEPTAPLAVPPAFVTPSRGLRDWKSCHATALEVFVFNLPISRAVYEAIAAITDDPAITELASALADGTRELVSFGQSVLDWLAERSTDVVISLPDRLAIYESLCHGSPQRLDKMAGQEITIEPRPGNLGTLAPEMIAAIFYDTLGTSILPQLERLGWPSFDAWQRRHRRPGRSRPEPAAIAAVGIAPR